MKKSKFFSLAALLMVSAAVIFSSCSSQKAVVSANQAPEEDEVAVKMSKSQELAEEKPALRDWGEASNFNMSFAKTYAEGQARAAFRRKIEAMVKTASKQAANGTMMAHSNGAESSVGEDQGFLSDAFAQQVASGVAKNVVVIKTETFKKKDGQYHVYVCTEYQGSVAQLAQELTNAAKRQVGQQVSDQEMLKSRWRNEQFEKSIAEDLEKLNAAQ